MNLQFLLSDKNLAGIGLAGLVLLAYVAGLLAPTWLMLAPLGYALGVIAVPSPSAKVALPNYESTEQRLHWLEQCSGKIPNAAAQSLNEIIEVSRDLLPRLKEMEKQGTLVAEHRTTLKRTITEYLPIALESYLKLPTLYAKSVKAREGKTAQTLLIEQLELLKSHVLSIQGAVLSQEVDTLVLHSKFLQQKFQESFSVTR